MTARCIHLALEISRGWAGKQAQTVVLVWRELTALRDTKHLLQWPQSKKPNLVQAFPPNFSQTPDLSAGISSVNVLR